MKLQSYILSFMFVQLSSSLLWGAAAKQDSNKLTYEEVQQQMSAMIRNDRGLALGGLVTKCDGLIENITSSFPAEEDSVDFLKKEARRRLLNGDNFQLLDNNFGNRNPIAQKRLLKLQALVNLIPHFEHKLNPLADEESALIQRDINNKANEELFQAMKSKRELELYLGTVMDMPEVLLDLVADYGVDRCSVSPNLSLEKSMKCMQFFLNKGRGQVQVPLLQKPVEPMQLDFSSSRALQRSFFAQYR